MSGPRVERVARQVQQEISTIVERDLADPRLNLVTFTRVQMTPDLRHARVYFSCLEGTAGKERCETALVHAIGMLRRELGRRLRLRYVPELHFVFDDSFERAARINALLAAKPGSGSKEGD
jgi:ribosome-binding factor A